ncbi:MAG: aminoacyl-tRNA hydrolase [Spirochaetaceae bacterium]|nr:aminoacyl-tRNA hydrolase [Spirochaetaceae bacterium]
MSQLVPAGALSMDKRIIAESVARRAEISFSRSSGPGGQNVNKVNTKVTASIPLDKLEGLSRKELDAVLRRLAGRIRGDGVLLVRVQDTRNQGLNREIALERMISLIIDAASLAPVRIPTRMSAARRRRNLDSKRAHAQTKLGRRRPATE